MQPSNYSQLSYESSNQCKVRRLGSKEIEADYDLLHNSVRWPSTELPGSLWAAPTAGHDHPEYPTPYAATPPPGVVFNMGLALRDDPPACFPDAPWPPTTVAVNIGHQLAVIRDRLISLDHEVWLVFCRGMLQDRADQVMLARLRKSCITFCDSIGTDYRFIAWRRSDLHEDCFLKEQA
ncbi:hypothetical protein HKX48_008000, partial [Thoreauomyces humboldtii]